MAEETTKASSLQSSLDHIGDQIEEVHKVVDRMCMTESSDKVMGAPTQEGAEPTAVHCQQDLTRLLERLENLADRVGHL